MVVVLIAEMADSLNEMLASLEAVEFEGLHECVSNVLKPFNTISVLDRIYFVRGHLDQLVSAEFVECLMLLLDFGQLSGMQGETMLELHWQVLILLNLNEQATLSRESPPALAE